MISFYDNIMLSTYLVLYTDEYHLSAFYLMLFIFLIALSM